MTYTIYEATIVASQHLLTALEGILVKAERHSSAPSFPTRKLANDMLPLSFQVYSACKLAEVQGLTLLKKDIPAADETYQGQLSTFAEMYTRIQDVKGFLETVDRDDALRNADDVQQVDFGAQLGNKNLSASSFCAGAGIPNIYFHISMAYAILRNAGVELGKFDYLAPFFVANIGM